MLFTEWNTSFLFGYVIFKFNLEKGHLRHHMEPTMEL